MKLKVLILLLSFIITTTFASIHETKHIGDDHHSVECEVCIVTQNLISDDINSNFSELTLIPYDEPASIAKTSYKYEAIITNHSNAPPKSPKYS